MTVWQRFKWELRLACGDGKILSVGKWLVRDLFLGAGDRLPDGWNRQWERDGKAIDRLHWSSGSPRVIIATNDCSEISGSFRSCGALAKELKTRQGVDVIVVSTCHGDGEAELREALIPFAVIPSRWWLVECDASVRKWNRRYAADFEYNHRAVVCWRKLIRRLAPDLVHVNSMACYDAGLAALSLDVPVVWHVREFLEEDHGVMILNREAGLRLVSLSSRVIAVSDCVKAKYDGLLGADKVVRVYNGVDIARFYRPDRTILSGGVATLLFLGVFQPNKGHLEFAKACTELHRRGYRDFRVLFVGGGDEGLRKQCAVEFASVGMESAVEYLGPQPRPEDWLEKSDVAFMCSRCEAFGRVTAEAMLAGCLVIGADTGGTRELVRDGVTGILYPRGENAFVNLAEKMALALRDVENSRRIAARGRSFARKNLSAANNAAGVAAVYREVCATRNEQGVG